MIYSIIILISSLLLFPVQSADNSFYLINAVAIEQCSTGSNTYLNQFDSKKMRCLEKTWRHISITMEYLCDKNYLKRSWTMKTNVNQQSQWPKKVHFFTINNNGTDYTLFDINANRQNEIIQETPRVFDSNNNQLIAYMWTIVRGAQCRIKYTVLKDICTTKKGQTFGAKLTEFVCYYGKQDFSFVNNKEREAFNKLLDDNIKTNSKNPSNSNNTNNPQKDPHLSTLADGENTFWQKNKTFMIAGIGGCIILVIIALIIIYRRRLTNKNMETRMSVDSNFE